MPLAWSDLLDELRRADLLIGAPADGPAPTAVGMDSRTIEPGMLYVAVRGSQADGHRFVADAVRRGAAAVVVESTQQRRRTGDPRARRAARGAHARAGLVRAPRPPPDADRDHRAPTARPRRRDCSGTCSTPATPRAASARWARSTAAAMRSTPPRARSRRPDRSISRPPWRGCSRAAPRTWSWRRPRTVSTRGGSTVSASRPACSPT